MRLSILSVFIATTLFGCAELKTVVYNLKVTQGEGATYYEARTNGLSNWDGQECTKCDLVTSHFIGVAEVKHCEFNLGLRKIIPVSGDPTYEMELIHYGDKFIVPEGENSLAFDVDGQILEFAKNDDTSGVFYDVTLDQLKAISAGTTVLIKILCTTGAVEKALGLKNHNFFFQFLHDPNGGGLPTPPMLMPNMNIPYSPPPDNGVTTVMPDRPPVPKPRPTHTWNDSDDGGQHPPRRDMSTPQPGN